MQAKAANNNSLRIGFAGTPDFAAVALQVLLEDRHQVVAVYTQPDRPAGRGRALQMSPVKQLASRHQIPVFQPQSLRDEAALTELKALNLDLLVVVAYGLILPEEALNAPTMGCWNIHASLLPRWRGAAPIQRAIQAGDTETGVCIMQMDAGLDTGPVLHQLRTAIATNETGGSLHDCLAALGGQALLEVLQAHGCGKMPTARKQAEEGVCYARKLSKAEAQIDWTQPADGIERSIRAFDPWPVAWAMLNDERIRVFAARVLPESATEPPGSILELGEDGIRVACGRGQLEITSLQKPGGKKISATDYYNAQRQAKK